MKGMLQIMVLVVLVGGCRTATLRTAPNDSSASDQAELDTEERVNAHHGMHPSWDRDGDGINDCENDGSCDHTVDYTQPREIPY